MLHQSVILEPCTRLYTPNTSGLTTLYMRWHNQAPPNCAFQALEGEAHGLSASTRDIDSIQELNLGLSELFSQILINVWDVGPPPPK